MNGTFGKDNLKLAWKWIRTNPDNKYKKHFRSSYERFSIIEGVFLDDLHIRLKNQIYEPTYCINLYHPKKSGGLRPLSLLTVEDQVVYQAIANVVAEKLYSNRYKKLVYKNVFGNIYAGKENIWFYQGWKVGYEGFKTALKKAFNKDKKYIAEFDIAACFDTIDHKVLAKLLRDLKVSPNLCERLTQYLEHWTANQDDPKLVKGHGLPQGPLSSGIFAEVVLKEFDSALKVKGVDYFRYVDDIKLMAQSETDLRIALAQLDLKAKSIGLTPQSSKINIHKIEKIENEFKSISLGGEFVEVFNETNNKLIRIVEKLTFRNTIEDETRFKYYFSVINPTAKMTGKVVLMYRKHPHLFEFFNNYLRKLNVVSKSLFKKLLDSLEERQPYDVSKTTFIDTLLKLPLKESSKSELTNYLKKKVWKRGGILKSDNQYLFSIVSADLLTANKLSENQRSFVFKDLSWFAKQVLLENLGNASSLPNDVLKEIKNCSNDREPDVQLAAYESLTKLLDPNLDSLPDTQTTITFRKTTNFSHNYLLKMGYTSTDPVTSDGIGRLFDEVFGNDRTTFSHVDWSTFMDSRKIVLWRQLMLLKASERSDAHNWINFLDNSNETIVRRLFDIYPLGTFGQYGGVMPAKAGKKCLFYIFNPILFNNLKAIHDRRSNNSVSHAYGKHKDNKLFEHSEIPTYKRKQRAALIALIRKATADRTMKAL